MVVRFSCPQNSAFLNVSFPHVLYSCFFVLSFATLISVSCYYLGLLILLPMFLFFSAFFSLALIGSVFSISRASSESSMICRSPFGKPQDSQNVHFSAIKWAKEWLLSFPSTLEGVYRLDEKIVEWGVLSYYWYLARKLKAEKLNDLLGLCNPSLLSHNYNLENLGYFFREHSVG